MRAKTRRTPGPEAGDDIHIAPESGDTGGILSDWGIGEAIQKIRSERGMTLADLAKISGVSAATLSKIENGRSGASFDTVYRVASAVGMSLDSILQHPTSQRFALGRRSITRAGKGMRFGFSSYDYEVPCSDLVSKAMVPLIMTIKTRKVLPRNEWASHTGEEYIYVLEGEIEMHTEFYEPTRLRKGDSAYIDSQMQHAFVNVGEGESRMLSLCLSSSLKDVFGELLPKSFD